LELYKQCFHDLTYISVNGVDPSGRAGLNISNVFLDTNKNYTQFWVNLYGVSVVNKGYLNQYFTDSLEWGVKSKQGCRGISSNIHRILGNLEAEL
jgi:hypothetical protein